MICSPSESAEITVEVTGVDDALKNEILDSLVITRQIEDESITDARVRALYRRSVTEVNDTLKSKGYYDPKVTNSLEKVDNNWLATFAIELGDPINISSLDIEIEGEAISDSSFTILIERFPLKTGDTLDQGLYESGKRSLQNLARERGYFDATFVTGTINIRESVKTADISLAFNSGVRYHFGEILINETVVGRERLDRMIPFKAGDPYDANLLITLNNNLRNSNYFNEVVVRPEIDNLDDNTVPISVLLSPVPKNNFKVGVGYGTDSGPRLVAGWDIRYLNRRGQKLETSFKASPTLSVLTAKHITPDFRRSGTGLNLSSSLSRENTDTHISNIFIFGAQQVQTRWNSNETLSLSYQLENFDVAGVSTNSKLLIPAVSYWKTVSESPIYTSKGYRVNLNLRGSMGGAISDLSFFQSTLSGKYILPAADAGRLIARAELGATYVENFDELPASIRYFAGGHNSIRGFNIQSLGPVNSDGEIIGGKYLAIGSLEYEHRIYNKVSAAVFTDFGNAFNSFSDHFVYSVGAGLRLLTPVGLIRMDFAFGISEDPETFRFHFNIGPDL